MAGVLVLDLSSVKVGWAKFETGMTGPASSFVELAPTGEDIGRLMLRYETWLDKMITEHDPTLIGYECPFVGAKTSQAVAKKLMGLLAYTEGTARRRGRGYWPANIPAIRKHFLGANPSIRINREGKTKKQIKAEYAAAKKVLRARIKTLTMLACTKRGWKPRNDDEADALALLDFVTHRAQIVTPWDNKPAPPDFFGGSVEKILQA